MEINVSSNIKDVTTDNFMSDVIEASKEKPIIVKKTKRPKLCCQDWAVLCLAYGWL